MTVLKKEERGGQGGMGLMLGGIAFLFLEWIFKEEKYKIICFCKKEKET